MNVFCSDKTGALTEGKVRIYSARDSYGQAESRKTLLYAYLNASFQSGFLNPIDEALREYGDQLDISSYQKLDELPYDSIRKRLSIVVSEHGMILIVTKGAFENVLSVCSFAEVENGRRIPLGELVEKIRRRYEGLSGEGFRTLGVAYRQSTSAAAFSRESEKDMTFLGFLVLFDPPKEGIKDIVAELKNMGITLKIIITGDKKIILAKGEVLNGPPF